MVISTGFSLPLILKTCIPFDLTAAALLGLQLYFVSFAYEFAENKIIDSNININLKKKHFFPY
jgi:hypothetical protein